MERRTLYGYRGRAYPESETTVVSAPLTGGLRFDVAPGQLPQGSGTSMMNVLVRDGRVERRSVLSRIDSTPQGGKPTTEIIGGVFEFQRTSNVAAVGWVSTGTRHYYYNFPSMSTASFVSAAGIGSVGSGQDPTTNNLWQAAPIYAGILDDNILVLAGHSNDTLLCGYYDTTGGVMVYSYVTGAPRAKAVATFDNFVMAFNTYEVADGGPLLTRVRWSDRGDPFGWTVGTTLAGFEDLLQMRGVGTAIRAMGQRLYLFSDTDVWIGGRGSDVFVFSFQEYERETGCPYPHTIQDTPLGILYLDRRGDVRLIPRDGGPSVVVSGAIKQEIRATLSPKENYRSSNNANRTHAVYDPIDGVYRLHLHSNLVTTDYYVHALHLDSAVWTRDSDNEISAAAMWQDVGQGGLAGPPPGVIAGSVFGTVYSTTTTPAGAGATSSVGGSGTVVLQTAPMLAFDARMKTVQAVRVTYDSTNSWSGCTVTMLAGQGSSSVQSYHLPLPASSTATVATAYLYGTTHAPVIRVSSDSSGYRLHALETVMQMSGR